MHPLPPLKYQIMKRAASITAIHLALLVLAAILLNNFVKPDHGTAHKVLAGFFIGTYALFGKAIANIAISSVRFKGLPQFDNGKKANAVLMIVLSVIALAGLFAWIVSWEGSTGVKFGFAAFAAALLSDYGITPFFKQFEVTKAPASGVQ